MYNFWRTRGRHRWYDRPFRKRHRRSLPFRHRRQPKAEHLSPPGFGRAAIEPRAPPQMREIERLMAQAGLYVGFGHMVTPVIDHASTDLKRSRSWKSFRDASVKASAISEIAC